MLACVLVKESEKSVCCRRPEVCVSKRVICVCVRVCGMRNRKRFVV